MDGQNLVEIIGDQYDAILYEVINMNLILTSIVDVIKIISVLVFGVLLYLICKGLVVKWYK